MGLLFAAIGATVAALVEASLVPYIQGRRRRSPHPVLIGGVIWTIAAGIDRGITWAFVGGLVLDSLLGRPLGGSAFALLVVVGGAALIAQPFPRLRLVAPIVAVPVLSIGVQRDPRRPHQRHAAGHLGSGDPIRLFIPDAIYDAIIGMFVGPLAVTLHDRRTVTERAEW